jgi:hypothetical protein
MNKERALELVEQLREEYDSNAVLGNEVKSDIIERNEEKFEYRAKCIPIMYDWVSGEELPDIPKIILDTYIPKFHHAERWFLIERLQQADNVPSVSISEITHNNLIEPLSEVFDPTHLYVPKSEPFLGVQENKSICSISDQFELETVRLPTDGMDDVNSCYAIHSDYIRLNQCTRLPSDQSEWLPDRKFSSINKRIPEHPFYCAYGESEDQDGDYVLASASILSKNPSIRNNAAVEINLDD